MKHRYKIRLEVETDQGIDGKTTTIIETVDEHETEGKIAINECIAINMAGMLKQLINSGRICGPSTFGETSQAFVDEMDEPLSSDYDEERLRKQNEPNPSH